MYDVIIIGGGAAGLMAAKLLSEGGKKILLLEARSQLGGRIHQTENFSFPANGGAEFIHGNLKTTFDLLEEAGLKKEKLKGKYCRVAKAKWTTEDDLVPHWELLLKKLNECKEDTTIDIFLEKFFKAGKYHRLKKQFRKYIEGYDAADPKYANVFAIRDEMKGEDEEQYRPAPDYTALINFLKAVCLKHKAVIKTNEPVTKIIRNRKIEVFTSSGKYETEKVVVAIPLAVLQRKRNDKNFIDLPSNLKDYTTAAKKIGNGGVIKFLLQFDRAFWLDKDFLKRRNIPAPSYIFADTIIPTWWTQYPSKIPLLTGWIAGPPSNKMKNYSENKFKNVALASLSSVFSMPVVDLETRLNNFKIMNWIKQPYILGGYSYSTLQTEKAREVLRKPFENVFYFAGEFISKNSSSTVDAALQSGKEAAENILNK